MDAKFVLFVWGNYKCFFFSGIYKSGINSS